MDIATLERTDRADVVDLWRAAGLIHPWHDPEREYDDALTGSTSTVLGVRVDVALIATVMVGFDGHRAWIYRLAVAGPRRGEGIGRELVVAAEEWAREAGARKVQLMVRRSNVAVQGFYERLGYEDADVVTLGRWLGEAR
jgi:ribosomal protein S18 acetylase RimI-like enzyme